MTIFDKALDLYHEGWGDRDPIATLDAAVRKDPSLLTDLLEPENKPQLNAMLWAATHWAKGKMRQEPKVVDQGSAVTQSGGVSARTRARMQGQNDAGSRRRTSIMRAAAFDMLLFGTVKVGDARLVDLDRAMAHHAKQVAGNAQRYLLCRRLREVVGDTDRTVHDALDGSAERLEEIVRGVEATTDRATVKEVRAEHMARVRPAALPKAS